MWSARSDNVPGGKCYRLLRDGSCMSFRDLLTGLENDALFARWYTALLADCSFGACFWEHPPLTVSGIDQEVEFVLIDAPSLAGAQANPRPFREYFASANSQRATCFQSLGGDATLIAPGPGIGTDAGAHLLSFVRQAPAVRVMELWHAVASAVRAQLSNRPLWLSTSGLGVYWLHVRIDSVPKYYQHHPYRSADWLQE